MPKHRHGYPVHGSRKWHGMAKRRIREELDYANLILRLAGMDHRIRVRRASPRVTELPIMSEDAFSALMIGAAQKARDFLSQLS